MNRAAAERMEPESALSERARAMLEEQILPFWKALRDDEFGGYFGRVNFDRSVDRRAEKGSILHSRILRFFSRCAKELGRADRLDEAAHAYRFLRDRCLDRECGGVYWSVDFRDFPIVLPDTCPEEVNVYDMRLTGHEDGSDGGIGFGLCDDIERAVIDEKIITSPRRYHTITESKNGSDAVPFRTQRGWIHIAEPSGYLIATLGRERMGGAREVANSAGKGVRFYAVSRRATGGEELTRAEEAARWQVCSPETSGELSAVAWFFAREIARTQRVPVGVIDCCWGGTSVTCWMSRERLSRTAARQVYLDAYAALAGDKSEAQYRREMEAYNAEWSAWNGRVQALRAEKPHVRWKEINRVCGICPWPQPAG